MALEVVVVNLNVSASSRRLAIMGGTHILASEGLKRVARLDNSKTFGVALDDILVLVML